MADVLPLTGADCFLRAFDRDTRRRNRAGHLSQLVLRLGPGFDPEALRAVIARATAANPILRAPVTRPAGIGAPVYQLGRAAGCPLPAIHVHPERAREPALPPVFFERLNDRFDARRGRLLCFDVVPAPDGGADLAMTWLHMLFDGTGSERFASWLDAVHRGERKPEDIPAQDAPDAPPSVVLPARMGERGQMATAWQAHMKGFADRPPRSLAGPGGRERQALRYALTTLPAEQSAAVVALAAERAGFLTPMLFYLAAAIRAHHAVFRARGVEPSSYVVPLPVNLRPKGGEDAMFRTRVSLLWFQVFPEQVDDMDALLEALRTQRRNAIKAKLVEGGVAAMDFARYAPAGVYARMARRSLRGELASFFFAYTDHFMEGTGSFLGAPIENGFHAPSVPASPGSGVILSLREGRLNFTHVYQQGAVSEAEHAVLRDQLIEDLRGSPG